MPFSYSKPDKNYVSHTLENGIPIYILIDKSLFGYMKKHRIVSFSGSIFVDLNPTLEYCNHLVVLGKEIFAKLYTDLFPGRMYTTNDTVYQS